MSEKAIRLFKQSRMSGKTASMAEKSAAMKVATATSTSWPVITISTRDRIEEEMKARGRADLNRAILDATPPTSPDVLDS